MTLSSCFVDMLVPYINCSGFLAHFGHFPVLLLLTLWPLAYVWTMDSDQDPDSKTQTYCLFWPWLLDDDSGNKTSLYCSCILSCLFITLVNLDSWQAAIIASLHCMLFGQDKTQIWLLSSSCLTPPVLHLFWQIQMFCFLSEVFPTWIKAGVHVKSC